MDKKSLLRQSLAKIMFQEIPNINNLVRQHPQAPVQLKLDNSPVTELDLLLSFELELVMKKHFPGFTFYSEENFREWAFPLIALDPLDGTREYVEGRPEWAISIGLFPSEIFEGQGWVYNPQTEELFSGSEPKHFMTKPIYQGEVSRSEWSKGLYQLRSSEKFHLRPMGSIAYKLGRLASGKTDFVVSLRPKNIWDIAGGTLLCQKAGLKFFSEGKEVTRVQKLYEPPLIWCPPELFSELSKTYS